MPNRDTLTHAYGSIRPDRLVGAATTCEAIERFTPLVPSSPSVLCPDLRREQTQVDRAVSNMLWRFDGGPRTKCLLPSAAGHSPCKRATPYATSWRDVVQGSMLPRCSPQCLPVIDLSV